jgi:hypothetical protein
MQGFHDLLLRVLAFMPKLCIAQRKSRKTISGLLTEDLDTQRGCPGNSIQEIHQEIWNPENFLEKSEIFA